MNERLHIFAVNATLDLCHTHHSRAQGGPAPVLPPLDAWLGAAVDTDAIELFGIKDIGDLRLSDYVEMAFAPEVVTADDARRMDALEGTVLLVPERALDAPPAPGAQLTLIATLPLAAPDHRAVLPKAAIGGLAGQPTGPGSPSGRMGGLVWLVLLLACTGLLVMWLA